MVYISGGNELINPEKLFSAVGIKQGMKVADLGCGATGRFSITAARLIGKTGQVYAVDILKSALAELSKKARLEGINNIKPVWANLEIANATNIKSQTIDLALLVNILFQSKDHQNIVKESFRVLKKNGVLLIVDWKQISIPFGPPAIDRVNTEEIIKIAENIGFSLIKNFDAGKFHFANIFQKK